MLEPIPEDEAEPVVVARRRQLEINEEEEEDRERATPPVEALSQEEIWSRGMVFLDRMTEKESRIDEHIERLETAMETLQRLQGETHPREIRAAAGRRKQSPRKKPVKQEDKHEEIEEVKEKTPKQKTKKKIKKKRNKKAVEKRDERKGIELIHGYVFLQRYEPTDPTKVVPLSNGATRTIFQNGDVQLLFNDGTIKIKRDGMTITKYTNGDYQQEFVDGASCYQYASNKAIELRVPDGRAAFMFENGQREEHFVDGRKMITFPDGSTMEVDNSGVCKLRNSARHTKRKKVTAHKSSV